MSDHQQGTEKVQIKIPAEVAKIMSKWGGHSVRLAAARGALPMSGPNLVMVLFVFYHGENEELKNPASANSSRSTRTTGITSFDH